MAESNEAFNLASENKGKSLKHGNYYKNITTGSVKSDEDLMENNDIKDKQDLTPRTLQENLLKSKAPFQNRLNKNQGINSNGTMLINNNLNSKQSNNLIPIKNSIVIENVYNPGEDIKNNKNNNVNTSINNAKKVNGNGGLNSKSYTNSVIATAKKYK